MTKKDHLDLIMLLSALESWAYAEGKKMPDYLSDDLSAALEKLCKEVLDGNLPGETGNI